MQTLLDSGILPILLDIMNTAEFKTRKEAIWAVCNAISGGTPDQIRLVQPSITACMCEFGIINLSRFPPVNIYMVDQNDIE